MPIVRRVKREVEVKKMIGKTVQIKGMFSGVLGKITGVKIIDKNDIRYYVKIDGFPKEQLVKSSNLKILEWIK